MKLYIEKLTYGGDGLARQDGMVWFIPGSAPGDWVEAVETERKKSYRRGRISELVEASPLRVTPPCPWFGRCGGCQWQHIDYSAQLEAKGSILAESARRALGIPVRIVPVQGSPLFYGYRDRITLHRRGGSVGYFAQHSRDLIEIGDCMLAADAIRQRIRDGILPAGEVGGLPERFELRLTNNGGVELVRDPSGAAFRQANRAGNELLRERLKESVLGKFPHPRIFDLYCGDGNLSISMAEAAERIRGWDSSKEAVSTARKSVEEYPGAEYRVGSVGKIASSLRQNAGETDVLILDPPRQGLGKDAAGLAGLEIPLVVYVSCDPSTQIRDLKIFLARGYHIESLEAFDLFPQTYHIESVALLSRGM
jgi:23S rRNA (uracil1939-C5)-methyltransferase